MGMEAKTLSLLFAPPSKSSGKEIKMKRLTETGIVAEEENGY